MAGEIIQMLGWRVASPAVRDYFFKNYPELFDEEENDDGKRRKKDPPPLTRLKDIEDEMALTFKLSESLSLRAPILRDGTLPFVYLFYDNGFPLNYSIPLAKALEMLQDTELMHSVREWLVAMRVEDPGAHFYAIEERWVGDDEEVVEEVEQGESKTA